MRTLPEIFSVIDSIQHGLSEAAKPVPRCYCPLAFQNELGKDSRDQEVMKSGKIFSFAFDVSTFKSEEITVKVKGHDVIIEAKHEEREDEHGFISRQFTRKIILPDAYDPDTVLTSLTADGKMTIKALKHRPKHDVEERIIPIKQASESDGQEDEEAKNAKEEKVLKESAVEEEPKEINN